MSGTGSLIQCDLGLAGVAVANYDPASGTSPTVGYCRPTVREILDAVKAV
jgi:hypothetical protein